MRHTHRDDQGPYSFCFHCGGKYRDDQPCPCHERRDPLPCPVLLYDDEPQCIMCGEPIDKDGEDGSCTACWEQELGEDIFSDMLREDMEQQKRDDYDDMISRMERGDA